MMVLSVFFLLRNSNLFSDINTLFLRMGANDYFKSAQLLAMRLLNNEHSFRSCAWLRLFASGWVVFERKVAREY